MTSRSRRLFVAKDEHKFSCAHMTLFPDGTKERIHGHNYRVAVQVQFEPDVPDPFLDFAQVKQTLAAICTELREHLLMPSRASAVQVVERDERCTDMLVCGKRYVIPSDEIIWLPIPNVVVEHLAAYLWERVCRDLADELSSARVAWLEVRVTEGPGQGAAYRDTPEEGLRDVR